MAWQDSREMNRSVLSEVVSICRYSDYRKPPCSLNISATDCSDEYAVGSDWWHIIAAKLAFVLIFEVRYANQLLTLRIGLLGIALTLRPSGGTRRPKISLLFLQNWSTFPKKKEKICLF